MPLGDVDLTMTWLWSAIGWCWLDYDLALMPLGDVDLIMMCHWLMLTWLWPDPDVPLVEALCIRHPWHNTEIINCNYKCFYSFNYNTCITRWLSHSRRCSRKCCTYSSGKTSYDLVSLNCIFELLTSSYNNKPTVNILI